MVKIIDAESAQHMHYEFYCMVENVMQS